MPKFRVAIVGAGLGGLFHALALEKVAPDVEVDIYDSVAQLTTDIGGGVLIHGRVWAAVEAIGLDGSLSDSPGARTDHRLLGRYRKGDQPEGVEFHTFGGNAGERIRAYHRNELQALLSKQIKTSKLHLSKRLVAYVHPQDPSEPIDLRFKDGTTTTCDVLVGADGIKSFVRQQMYTELAERAEARGEATEAARLESLIPPVWSGSIIRRSLVQADALLARSGGVEPQFLKDSVIYIGKGSSGTAYPIGGGRINFSGTSFDPAAIGTVYDGPWVTSTDQAELKRVFKYAEPSLANLVDCIENATVWSVNMAQKLPTYVDGRVAILGDAAHAMTPYQASGAGQAFEDGYMLARLLAHPKVTRDNLAKALTTYDSVRRPFSQNVAAVSLESGRCLHLCSEGLENLTPEQSCTGKAVSLEQLKELGNKIAHATDWMFESTIAGDNEVAIQQLEKLLT